MSSGEPSTRRIVARERLVEAIGHDPDDDALLSQAFNHRSWCAEHAEDPSNERLEFLGDSVLGFLVADEVYRREASLDEGALTDIRKAVVNAVCLAEVATELDLGAHLRLGRGEEHSGGRDKPSILSDAFEAVLGAVYLEAGVDAARAMVLRVLGSRIDEAIASGGRNLDHKSRLQEAWAAEDDEPLRYTLDARGPDHAREFTAEVVAGDRVLGVGEGRSKKQAEQAAASAALAAMEDPDAGTDRHPAKEGAHDG